MDIIGNFSTTKKARQTSGNYSMFTARFIMSNGCVNKGALKLWRGYAESVSLFKMCYKLIIHSSESD